MKTEQTKLEQIVSSAYTIAKKVATAPLCIAKGTGYVIGAAFLGALPIPVRDKIIRKICPKDYNVKDYNELSAETGKISCALEMLVAPAIIAGLDYAFRYSLNSMDLLTNIQIGIAVGTTVDIAQRVIPSINDNNDAKIKKEREKTYGSEFGRKIYGTLLGTNAFDVITTTSKPRGSALFSIPYYTGKKIYELGKKAVNRISYVLKSKSQAANIKSGGV